MADKIYIVEGRQFRSDADHKKALRDQQIIEKLRAEMKGKGLSDWQELRDKIENKIIQFSTMLGEDFLDEVIDEIERLERAGASKSANGIKDKSNQKKSHSKAGMSDKWKATRGESDPRIANDRITNIKYDADIEEAAKQILKRKERRRRIIVIACATIAVCGIGFFVVNSILDYKKSMSYQMLSNIREQASQTATEQKNNEPIVGHGYQINYTEDKNAIEANILPEFKEMLAVNSKLIGWVTIDDTNINYPVAQTIDNSYYLDHDLNQNYDRNGTIFLDTNCDVLKPTTNFILYGHHMQSGNMFGNLGKFEDKAYWEKHKYITFDTIYEYGTWEIMYVFRSHVYNETEVAFKYYQFYDAYSEVEFNSYMQEMANMSLYDTGVTAEYGDRLLTLSTCDYQEKDGRFVVVAKKIK